MSPVMDFSNQRHLLNAYLYHQCFNTIITNTAGVITIDNLSFITTMKAKAYPRSIFLAKVFTFHLYFYLKNLQDFLCFRHAWYSLNFQCQLH